MRSTMIQTPISLRIPLYVVMAWVSAGTCFVALPSRIRPNIMVAWKKRISSRPLIVSSAHTLVRGEASFTSDGPKDENSVLATARFISFATDISNARQRAKTREDGLKPVRSLVRFLEGARFERNDSPSSAFIEAFDAAIISGVRAAGSAGEFRLIFKILEACLQFASVQGPILPPRLFGEAIDNLSRRTKANASKIRQIWQLGLASKELLREPLGPFELNTMIKALASRGKIRASLDMVREDDIVPDSYTASTIFGVLNDSIETGQAPIALNETALEVSPCWQWNEAVSLLDETFTSEQLNNYAYTAALKLNERASEVFSSHGGRHYGAKAAMSLLERMKRDGTSPDVVTCSSIMSAFDKGYKWNAAVTLLNAMIKRQTSMEGQSVVWSLPSPNVYSYATAISACARCNKYEEALEIMSKMRHADCSISPNTWVYNAALAACVQHFSAHDITAQGRDKPLQTALSLLQLMDEDLEAGLDTAPDTVTYNTILATMDGMGDIAHSDDGEIICEFMSSDVTKSFSCEADVATELIEQMKQRGIPRDEISYRNAIKAVRYNGKAVLKMLKGAMNDTLGTSSVQPRRKGGAMHGKAFFNAGLEVLAERGDVKNMNKAFALMTKAGVKVNSESLTHLLTALSKSGRTSAVVTLVESLQGSESVALREEFGHDRVRDDVLESFPQVTDENLAAAITACVVEQDLESALGIVASMKANGRRPTDESMQEIAHAYCRMAMDFAEIETKRELKFTKKQKRKKGAGWKPYKTESRSRAQSAYKITMSLESPHPHLLSAVSRALSAAGMWEEGRNVLRSLHKAAIKEQKVGSRSGPHLDRGARDVLPGLHRSLLKLCARNGNITAALAFVDDIQTITKWYPSTVTDANETMATLSAYLLSEESSFNVSQEEAYASVFQSLNDTLSLRMSHGDVGMKAEDWKLLMISASKSGHWKVCMSTLQFLRPFLEATNPHSVTDAARGNLDKQYGKISRALTAAILCFEMRSQYAWAVRAIDDWILWSGRRPPEDGAFAAFRILAARCRGSEVKSLLSHIVQVPDKSAYATTYEQALYVGAISSLHSNGLYDDADDIFIEGVSAGQVPFEFSRGESDGEEQLTLDLHGMNTALAHSAVRIALQREIEVASFTLDPQSTTEATDLIVVTGLGRNSGIRFRPVLRPEVQRMLQEEFYPPLSTMSVPGNMGALRVPAEDITAWLDHRRQEKGARMLVVADMIKNLSSVDRLRRMITLSLGSEGGESESEPTSDS